MSTSLMWFDLWSYAAVEKDSSIDENDALDEMQKKL